MTLFLGTFTGRLDSKGRVTFPPSFRAILRLTPEATSFILRPSHRAECVECWTPLGFETFAPAMQSLDLFSEDEIDMSYALYADASYCEPDKEGRAVLPEKLVKKAGLTDAVSFVGLRNRFEIWEPARYEAHLALSLARLKERRLTLPQVVA